MNVFFSVDNFAIAKVLFNEEENSLYFLIFTYKMIKYGNRDDNSGTELGHFGNPRSNETLYNNFQIRFSTKKVSLAYFCAYHSHRI